MIHELSESIVYRHCSLAALDRENQLKKLRLTRSALLCDNHIALSTPKYPSVMGISSWEQNHGV